MRNVLRAGQLPALPPPLDTLLGDDARALADIERESQRLFPDNVPILWECDARSFAFHYISANAEAALGFSCRDWLQPMFWAEEVVYIEDRDDAVTYCSLATAKGRDHMFEYRARAADGRIVWLRDYVRVVRDERGDVARLRGLMFDITGEKTAARNFVLEQRPSRAELRA